MKKILIALSVLILTGVLVIFIFKDKNNQKNSTVVTVGQLLPENLKNTDSAPTEIKLPGPEKILDNLDVPWEVEFIGESEIMFTERSGTLGIYKNGNLKRIRIENVSEAGEGGLLGLALDPEFNTNRLLFLYYTYRQENKIYNRVVRFQYRNQELRPDQQGNRALFSLN